MLYWIFESRMINLIKILKSLAISKGSYSDFELKWMNEV